MAKTKFNPKQAQEAHRILEAIKQGDTTKATVNPEADTFPAYMATLACAEATMKTTKTHGMCFRSPDEPRKFQLKKFDWLTMVSIARHLGHCRICYEYFLRIEEDMT